MKSQPIVQSAVTGAAFVGRMHILRNINAAIKQQRSICLVGGLGMGRTSTLAQLQYQAEQAWLLPQRQMVPLCVRIDLGKLQQASPHQLASQIFLAICEVVLSPYVQRHTDPPVAPTMNFSLTKAPFDLLWSTLETLWQKMNHTIGWCRYALLLDHAEALSEAHHASMMLNWVSATDAFKPMACVFAVDPVTAYRLAEAHPWAALPHFGLWVLTHQELQQFAKVAKIPHDTILALAEACGKNPYLLSLLCQTFHGSTMTVAAALVGIQPMLQPWLQKVLESLHPKGPRDGLHLVHRVLQHLLTAQEPVPIKLIQQQVLPLSVKSAIDCLLAMGLVECTTRAEQTWLHANHPVWNLYYRENYRDHAE